MSREQDWLEVAKGLRTGEKARIYHCTNSKSMVVSASHKYWSGYCFRCKTRFVERKTQLSPKELEKILERQAQFTQEVKLPIDSTNDLPLQERLWLYRAGLYHPKDWERFRIQYSPSMKRVIIPVYGDGDELRAVVARSCNREVRPKYLTSQIGNPIFRVGKGDTLVVVEDLLSAIRVGKFTTSCAALGTHLTDELVLVALQYPLILLWFDGDPAGREADKHFGNRLRSYGVRVLSIRTQKDPKEYSDEEIVAKLSIVM